VLHIPRIVSHPCALNLLRGRGGGPGGGGGGVGVDGLPLTPLIVPAERCPLETLAHSEHMFASLGLEGGCHDHATHLPVALHLAQQSSAELVLLDSCHPVSVDRPLSCRRFCWVHTSGGGVAGADSRASGSAGLLGRCSGGGGGGGGGQGPTPLQCTPEQ
jgi:hypothetical protein